MNAPFEGIGASVRRKEDLRFLTGHGHYVDDINRPGQLHAVIKRSDRPHAKIVSIDATAAKAAPGVVAVYTGADFVRDRRAALRLADPQQGRHRRWPSRKHPVLADGKVRHVGDPIAVVIAETKQQARDAAELLAIELEDLPSVVDRDRGDRARRAAGARRHAPGNVCYDWHLGDKAARRCGIRLAPRKS